MSSLEPIELFLTTLILHIHYSHISEENSEQVQRLVLVKHSYLKLDFMF